MSVEADNLKETEFPFTKTSLFVPIFPKNPDFPFRSEGNGNFKEKR